MERFGDEAARRLLQTYRAIVRRAVAREKGGEVKTEGDSFYVVFPSGTSALRCAIAIQRAAGRRRRDPLTIGIGIHAGEAAPFERQYVGGSVNIAARLASAAAAGEILVSETVRGLIRTSVRVPLHDRGALTLKGVAEPIRAYAVRVIARPVSVLSDTPPKSPIEVLRSGQLDEAAQHARALFAKASADVRCDALAVLAVVSASRGDLEGALGHTERLLSFIHRASNPSWVRLAYALRAWLYSLARQPGEASAELERAIDRPDGSPSALLFMLLAITMVGGAVSVKALRQLTVTGQDESSCFACTTVAEVLAGRAGLDDARRALTPVSGPFLTELIMLQLAARTGARRGTAAPQAAGLPGAGRLAALIFQAVQ